MDTRRRLFTRLGTGMMTLALLAGASRAQTAAPAIPADRKQQLDAAIAKSNAYIGLMNRTMRASQSWDRYTSWVDMRRGPTGRERYITYGLYSLYDVRGEIDKARAAMGQEPKVPELDASVGRYIEAYEAFAPLITQANSYYERKDYKADKMVEGRALHEKMVPAAAAFLKERAQFELLMRAYKRELDKVDLAAIEVEDGRKTRWHVKNVMMQAGEIVEKLPNRQKPLVDMKEFSADIARFAIAVREFDSYAQANPGKLSSFQSDPSSFLGQLREFEEKLERARGDVRRGAGSDLTWIINKYNMMISSSRFVSR